MKNHIETQTAAVWSFRPAWNRILLARGRRELVSGLLLTILALAGCGGSSTSPKEPVNLDRETTRQDKVDGYVRLLYPRMLAEFENLMAAPGVDPEQIREAYRIMGSVLSKTGQWDLLRQLYSSLPSNQKVANNYTVGLEELVRYYPHYEREVYKEIIDCRKDELRNAGPLRGDWHTCRSQLYAGYMDDALETAKLLKPSRRTVYFHCRLSDALRYNGRQDEGAKLLNAARDMIPSLDDSDREEAQTILDDYEKISEPFSTEILANDVASRGRDGSFNYGAIGQFKAYAVMLSHRNDGRGVAAVQDFLVNEFSGLYSDDEALDPVWANLVSFENHVGLAPSFHIDLLAQLDVDAPKRVRDIVKNAVCVYRRLSVNPDEAYLNKVDTVLRSCLEKLPQEEHEPRIYTILHDIAEDLGDKKKAVAVVDKVVEMARVRDYEEPVAHFLLRHGRTAELEEYCKRLTPSDHRYYRDSAANCLAVSLARKGRFDEARRLLESQPSKACTFPLNPLIFEYYLADKPDSAMQLLEEELAALAISEQQNDDSRPAIERLDVVCLAITDAVFLDLGRPQPIRPRSDNKPRPLAR